MLKIKNKKTGKVVKVAIKSKKKYPGSSKSKIAKK